MMDADRELQWLRRVRDFSQRLAAEKDVRRLLPQILDAAVELTQAERGYLVRVLGKKPEGGWSFRVEVARGFDQASLQGAAAAVSRTVVKRVLERDERGLVTTSEEDQDLVDVSSIQARRVLAIACVPLRLRGQPLGVLYLDHRFDKAAFGEADLPFLRTFADQAALALETADLVAAPPTQAPAAQTVAVQVAPDALRALEAARARDEARPANAPPAVATSAADGLRFGGLVSASPAMHAMFEDVERAARSPSPVLIRGESGTGKELVARELHARSGRGGSPFLAESCAASADALLERALFGHRKGAFEGAAEDRPGLFVMAGEGTLFLDEVADLSLGMQAKLLRALQEGAVRPVGGTELVPFRCRIVVATQRDLPALVEAGTLRADLYYRLDVLRILVPPLRQRREDVLLLFEDVVTRLGAPPLRFSDKARELVTGFAWPGNVRQLENEARRLVALGLREVTHVQLSPEVREGRGVARGPVVGSGKTLGDVERDMVEAALRDCKGNKSRAARQLGIPRSTLYHLIDRYGLP
jgi:serine/threonine-protein kinase PknK